MRITLRAKVLVGLVVAIAGYIVFAPTESPSVESRVRAASMERMPAMRRPKSHGESALPTLFLLAHRVSEGASKEALFAAHSWNSPLPPPPESVVREAPVAAPPAVPTAPPLPFTYIGSYTPYGSAPVFFLMQGDRVYDARIGDTLDNAYTLDAFDDRGLFLTYKPLNIRQQLMLGGTR